MASTGQGFIGTNMFAYCGNNPINADDPTGHCWITNLVEKIKGAIKKVVVGSARPYEEYQNYAVKPGQSIRNAYNDARATSPNCYAYAIGGISKGIDPGYYSGISLDPFNSLDTIASAVEADMKALGRSFRPIAGPYAPIESNEYRIALSVGKEPFGYAMIDGQYVPVNDYHFMVQTDSGRWAEKHGSMGASVLHNIGETPDTIPWDLGDMTGYYDSGINYYAIGGL